MYIHTYIQIQTHTHTHTHIQTYIHIHIHIHIHTYTYTHTHTHTHIYILHVDISNHNKNLFIHSLIFFLHIFLEGFLGKVKSFCYLSFQTLLYPKSVLPTKIQSKHIAGVINT